MQSTLARRLGLPALFLSGAMFGSLITGAIAGQPHMHNALTALNNALTQLNEATTDKAGHRASAANLVEQAISQVKAGIAAGAQ